MTDPRVNAAALYRVGQMLTATSVVIFVVAAMFFFGFVGADLSDATRNLIVGALAFVSVLDGGIGWAMMKKGRSG